MGEIEVTENPGAKCRQRSCQGVSIDARILASNSERTIVQVTGEVSRGVYEPALQDRVQSQT